MANILKWTGNNDKGAYNQTLNLDNWYNQRAGDLYSGMLWGGVAQYDKYLGIPVDLGKTNKSNYAFGDGGINYSRFEDPELAKKMLAPYLERTQKLTDISKQAFQEGNRALSQQFPGQNYSNPGPRKVYFDAVTKGLQENRNFIDTARQAAEEKVGKTTPDTYIDTLSYGARALVNKALGDKNKNLTDLAGQSWWSKEPLKERQEAYTALQKITGSAQGMADYVKSTGMTNMQDHSWWSSSPHKQDAWNIISGGTGTTQDGTGTTSTGTGTTGTGVTGTGTTGTGTTGTVASQIENAQKIQTGDPIADAKTMGFLAWKNIYGGTFTEWSGAAKEGYKSAEGGSTTNNKATDSALKTLESNVFFQNLPEDQKAFLRMTVKSWDTEKEINMENVLAEFEKIKTTTIDPQFKEQANVFINDVKTQMGDLEYSRNMELETERTLAGNNIRQAKEGLEKAGMTFSGKGIEQLGADSAYAQEDQTPFGGKYFEGKTNQANRLMASSSLARYQQNLQRMGRQAENALGQQATGLVPGASPAGVTTGTIEANKQQQLGSTLSQLAGQQRQLNSYKQPIDFTNFNQTFQ